MNNKLTRKPQLALAGMLYVCLIMVSCAQENPAVEGKTEVVMRTASAMCATFTMGVVVDQGMRVVDLDAGGLAEKAGVQRGDILQSLDGTPFVTDGEGIKELLSQKTTTAIGVCNDVIIIDENTGEIINPQSPLPLMNVNSG